MQKKAEAYREAGKKKSLLLTTPVPLGQTVRISPSIISHYVSLTRDAMSGTSVTEQIQINEALRGKPEEVKSNFRQLRFLKSFLTSADDHRLNFFVFSPSWCKSSREYRGLFEAYLKQFPESKFHLHSVVIEDSKEKIFQSKLFTELFPHPEQYTHESTPRFLAIEIESGQTAIWEEGEALKVLYDRYFQSHRGFLRNERELSSKKSPSK